MTTSELMELADLLRERNLVDERIGRLINRPMTSRHAGEWIASRIFGIELEHSAVTEAIGRFRSGPLAGKTVNVKWYLKHEGMLDMTASSVLDYYLVMTGAKASAHDNKRVRPWLIHTVYLFNAQQLLAELRGRGVKIGVATSVVRSQWQAAEIYPTQTSRAFLLTPEQRQQLQWFSGADLAARPPRPAGGIRSSSVAE